MTVDTVHLIRAGQGEHWLVGGETTTIKVSGRETAGGMLVLETGVPPGGGPPTLVRHDFVETFYVLESTFEFGLTDAAGVPSTVVATPGDTIFVPALAWHKYRNVGAGRGRLLTIFAETAIEELASVIGQRLEDPANPPVAAAPPAAEDARRAEEIMRTYKIEIRQI